MSLATIICPKKGKLGKNRKSKIPNLPQIPTLTLPSFPPTFTIKLPTISLHLPSPCSLVQNNERQ